MTTATMNTAAGAGITRASVQAARRIARARTAWDPLTLDAEAEPVEAEPPPLVLPVREALPLPHPARWAGVLSRAVVEVLIGTRPATQVRRWLDEDVWDVVNRRAELGLSLRGPATSPPAVRVLRVHHCAVSETDHEFAVVIHDGTRVRAVAMRLHLYRGRWLATAVRIA